MLTRMKLLGQGSSEEQAEMEVVSAHFIIIIIIIIIIINIIIMTTSFDWSVRSRHTVILFSLDAIPLEGAPNGFWSCEE